MNYQKIRETKIQMSDLKLRLQTLEELQKETYERIKETQNSCNHDLIFINRKYKNLVYNYLQIGQCLICGKDMTLKPNNCTVDKNIVISSEQILDIAPGISDEDFEELMVEENNCEIEEAQRVFNSLTNDADYLYSRDCIKNEIVEAVKNIKGNTKIK